MYIYHNQAEPNRPGAAVRADVPRNAFAPAMETYAICLVPRGEFVERHLRRAEAERYAEVFNRLMRHDGVGAEIVPEPVLAGGGSHRREYAACLLETTAYPK